MHWSCGRSCFYAVAVTGFVVTIGFVATVGSVVIDVSNPSFGVVTRLLG